MYTRVFNKSMLPRDASRRDGGSSSRRRSRTDSDSSPRGGRSYAGYRKHNAPHRRPQRGGRRHGGANIHFSKFINKAVPQEAEATFVPTHKFTDFQIGDSLKAAITAKGYETPTPIQDKSIPHILEGKDVLGIANTGTGKTGAFLIPLIHKVQLKPNESVLIVAPTRELATQIHDELKGFTSAIKSGKRIFSVSCVGGSDLRRQMSDLRYHNNFVIGTPGRLKDLIERKMIRLNEFNTVVLDEADRMLDMGFINDMRYIMSRMPAKRHTLFFSATLSPDIEKLIGDFLTDPVSVSVKSRDTSKNVDQDIVRIPHGTYKFDILCDLLRKPEFSKVLVFGRTKHGVERLANDLVHEGIKAESIHGDKTQGRREQALRRFKENRVQVLVATDVAARGLDIPNVTHVINYDVPMTYDDYVHRIGRTGRSNKTGVALTFIE
jgi:superfamily II DNA/RNA helicase